MSVFYGTPGIRNHDSMDFCTIFKWPKMDTFIEFLVQKLFGVQIFKLIGEFSKIGIFGPNLPKIENDDVTKHT